MKKFCKWFDRYMSQIIVAFSIIMIILFTVICMIIQYKTSVEVSSMLIEKFYDFFGYELFIIGGIKVSKNIKEIFVDKLTPDDECQEESEV